MFGCVLGFWGYWWWEKIRTPPLFGLVLVILTAQFVIGVLWGSRIFMNHPVEWKVTKFIFHTSNGFIHPRQWSLDFWNINRSQKASVHHASLFSAFLHWYYFEHPFSRLIFFSGLCCRQQKTAKILHPHSHVKSSPRVWMNSDFNKFWWTSPPKNPKHLATPPMTVCALCPVPSLLRPPWIKVMSDAHDPRRNNHSSSYRLDPYLAAVFSNKDGGCLEDHPRTCKWLILITIVS